VDLCLYFLCLESIWPTVSTCILPQRSRWQHLIGIDLNLKIIYSTKAFKMLTTFQSPYPPSPTEIGILVVLSLSFLVTIIHKIASNTAMFLLQPCHVSAGLLIAVMMWPDKRSPIPHLLLNVYLHTAWG
jgi:TMEM164 family